MSWFLLNKLFIKVQSHWKSLVLVFVVLYVLDFKLISTINSDFIHAMLRCGVLVLLSRSSIL